MKFWTGATATTEITGIVNREVKIDHRINHTTQISFGVQDWEGSAYNTYKDSQGQPLFITNNAKTKYLFIGRMRDISLDQELGILTISGEGESDKLNDAPHNQNYVYASGRIDSLTGNYQINVTQDNDAHTPFTWTIDDWKNENGKDYGIVLSDHTGESTATWTVASYHGHNQFASFPTGAAGNADIAEDGLVIESKSAAGGYSPNDGRIDLTLVGTPVPTTQFLKKIVIDYRIQFISPTVFGWCYIVPCINGEFDENQKVVNFVGRNTHWLAGIVTLEGTATDLATYLDSSGGNFTGIQLRVQFGQSSIPIWVNIDKLAVTVYYNTKDFSPFMQQITANGASSVTTTKDVVAAGVAVDDTWKIGQSYNYILSDISSKCGVAIILDSSITGYLAKDCTALTGLQIVQEICKINGAEWFEVFEDGGTAYIQIAKSGNFTSSGHSLTSAAYHKMKVERPYNQYKQVWYYGNQGLVAYAIDHTITNVSTLIKREVADELNTISDVQQAANSLLDKLKVLRPALSFMLSGTGYESIRPGFVLDLLTERPNIRDPPTTIAPWVQGAATVAYEGTYDSLDDVLKVTDTGIAHLEYSPTETIGDKTFYVQVTSASAAVYAWFGAGNSFYVNFDATGRIFAKNGASTQTLLDPYAANTWYKFRVTWDTDTDTYSIWLDDVAKGTNWAFWHTSGAIDEIRLENYASTTTYLSYASPWTYNAITYPIRRVTWTQTHPNGILEAEVFAGLGETPEDERLANNIRKLIDSNDLNQVNKVLTGTAEGLPEISHINTTNKNGEAAYRHITTTEYGYIPSSDQKAALVGTPGTPATGNKFLTADALIDSIADSDTTHAPTRNAVFDALALKAKALPVGAVYFSTNNTNPGTSLEYGTWTQIGQGKFVVGQDGTDPDFDVAKETGGAKTTTLAEANIPSMQTDTESATHYHNMSFADGAAGGLCIGYGYHGVNGQNSGTESATHHHHVGTAAPTAISRLPPYIVLYMWERTA